MRIAVITGGDSLEKEIALKGAKAVEESLKRLGYDVNVLEIDKDLCFKLTKINPKKAFIIAHGTYGEDGRVQGLLDILGIPYIGSNTKTSAICMDKDFSKQIFEQNHIKTPKWKAYKPKDTIDWSIFPCIAKPASAGSSFGLFKVEDDKSLKEAAQNIFKIDDKLIVEEFIEGKDMTVGYFKGAILEPIEIIPKKGIYDFESKYTKGMSEYIFVEDENISKRLKEITAKIIDIFELKDIARVDFRVKGEDIYTLEVNTIPGLTELSLLPMALKKAGISFDKMVEMLVNG
ncbi:MAG: D-alanine--D-alanine ligase family protein [Hydrogenobaculum sp.]|nr:MAG: D-alanine--D-alanine ligase [Hydrogenobaculum sp.]PMP93398.1 MAG: D-alanine--D-alanine ligase [Hydrogenobaculum sp.]